MPNNFHWTTDEDDNWEEIAPPTPDPPGPRRIRWSRWLMLFLILVVGGLFFWQARQQVTAVTTDVEADILSSQALLEQAKEQADIELFTTVLSGRDSAWTAAQQTLFQLDLLWNRQPLGLNLLPTEPAIISMTVAPDLQSAEMLVERQYAISETDDQLADGRAASTDSPLFKIDEVTLLHPLTFRKGEARWLLSPPPDEYWGRWQQAEGHFITLIYPERDAAIALRLLSEMDDQVKTLCRFEPAAHCPGGWRLLVRLDTDPASLTAVADPQQLLMPDPVFDLPTPSLVGLPVDENGYKVLAQVYAGKVVNRAIVDVVAILEPRPLAAGDGLGPSG